MLWPQSAAESLEEIILSEKKVIGESSYTVSGVLSSSDTVSTSRSVNLKELLEVDAKYTVYKFNPRQETLSLDGVLYCWLRTFLFFFFFFVFARKNFNC